MLQQPSLANSARSSHASIAGKRPAISRLTLSILLCALPWAARPALAQEVNDWTAAVDDDMFDDANWSLGTAPNTNGSDLVTINGPTTAVWFVPGRDGVEQTYLSTSSLSIGSGAGQSGAMRIDLGDMPDNTFLSLQTFDSGFAVGSQGGSGRLDLFDPLNHATLTLNDAITVGDAGTGTLSIHGSGAQLVNEFEANVRQSSAGLGIGTNGGTGTLDLDGGSWLINYLSEPNPSLSVGQGPQGKGTVNVLAGGKLSDRAYSGGGSGIEQVPVFGLEGGSGTLTISGQSADGNASAATFGHGLTLGQGLGSTGTANVLSGGKLLSYAPQAFDPDAEIPEARLGVEGGSGAVTVSGAGSVWYVGGPTEPYYDGNPMDYTRPGQLHVGVDGNGTLTLADGGRVAIGIPRLEYFSDPDTGSYGHTMTQFEGGLGNLYLAEQAGSTGTLNIGAAAGSAAVAPGTLEALGIVFGDGNGTVAFNHTSSDYRFATPLSGNGTLANLAGTTWLDGDNSGFGGTTVLSGGVLGVGNAQSLGGSAVEVVGNAALAYADTVNLANAITIDNGYTLETQVTGGATQAGTISGGGGLRKTGAGTLALTSANSYSGQTEIAEGSLQLLAGGSLAASSRVLANALFDVSQAGGTATIVSLAGNGNVALGGNDLSLGNAADTFNGTFSGTGTLVLAAGNETLAGDSSGFAGQTRIDGGVLTVNGIQAGVMQVNAGGTLAGSGTVGNTTVQSGGVIAPAQGGVTPTTLRIAGDLTLEQGSTYRLNLLPTATATATGALQPQAVAGQSNDLLDVSGIATLNGADVSVTKVGGVYLPGSTWTIVSAGGGLTGTFGNLIEDLPYVSLITTYDANNAYLLIERNDEPLCQPGMTANQCSVAGGVESLPSDDDLNRIIASQGSKEAAARALDLLSGEIHASARSALIEDSRFLREATQQRLRMAGDASDTAGSGTWAHAFGSWGRLQARGDAAELTRDIGGLFVGLDHPTGDDWQIGGVTGYSRSSMKVDARSSSGDVDSYHLGVYAGGGLGTWSLRTGLGYSWNNLSTRRWVEFPGFSGLSTARYQANTLQAYGELGYPVQLGRTVLEPFVNAAYVSVENGGFSEQGGIEALTARGATTRQALSTLGLRASADLQAGTGSRLALNGMLGWRHAYRDAAPLSTFRFQGGSDFVTDGLATTRNALAVEAALEWSLGKATRAGIQYSGLFGDRFSDNGAKLYVDWKF